MAATTSLPTERQHTDKPALRDFRQRSPTALLECWSTVSRRGRSLGSPEPARLVSRSTQPAKERTAAATRFT